MPKFIQTVGAMLVDSDGRILLGLRSKMKKKCPGCWDIIGGHVESGESLADALIREVVEEIGVLPTAFRCLGSFCESDLEQGTTLHHVYEVTRWAGGPPINKSIEHTAIAWFSRNDILRLENLVATHYRELLAPTNACE